MGEKQYQKRHNQVVDINLQIMGNANPLVLGLVCRWACSQRRLRAPSVGKRGLIGPSVAILMRVILHHRLWLRHHNLLRPWYTIPVWDHRMSFWDENLWSQSGITDLDRVYTQISGITELKQQERNWMWNETKYLIQVEHLPSHAALVFYCSLNVNNWYSKFEKCQTVLTFFARFKVFSKDADTAEGYSSTSLWREPIKM